MTTTNYFDYVNLTLEGTKAHNEYIEISQKAMQSVSQLLAITKVFR